MTHHPKGGMCASCQRSLDDCSRLPFAQMPVIERTPESVIVRCSEYRREK